MNNIKKLNYFQINDNNYVISDNALNLDFVKNMIDCNTSIIYFDDNFSINNPIYNMFLEKEFDKLILVSSQKHTIPRMKRLFLCSKINQKILSHVKKKLLIVIQLNNNYKSIRNIINNLILLQKLSTLSKITTQINYQNTNNINSFIIKNDASIYFNDIISTFIALSFDEIKNRYEYLYDTVCDYLDNEFSKNNFCDFQNDACIANRKKCSLHSTMGCCYSFEYSKFWEPTFTKNIKLCQYMDCKTCSTKCITCKLFTCKYLKKQNIQFDTHKILLLDCFFNSKQHLILKNNFFRKREEIIEKLLENNKKSFLTYYLGNDYMIK